MSDIDRKRAIEELKREYCGDSVIMRKAKDFAVASLEADEAYQLEYEKPEICEDCISRKEIIDRCNIVISHGVVDKEGMHPISAETVLKETLSMPSVLPKAEVYEDCVPRKVVERIIKSPRSQEQMLTILNSTPSVLPKAKKGHWIKEDRGRVEYSAVCSECGDSTFWSEKSNFCPNCGADMREVKK